MKNFPILIIGGYLPGGEPFGNKVEEFAGQLGAPQCATGSDLLGDGCCSNSCAYESTSAPLPVSIKSKLIDLDESLAALTNRFAGIGRAIRVDGTNAFARFPKVETVDSALDYLQQRVNVLNDLALTFETKLGL